MSLPFPDDERVEAAAEAVLRALRNNHHIYSHSLRYLKSDQMKIARRVAWAALSAAWVKWDPGPEYEYPDWSWAQMCLQLWPPVIPMRERRYHPQHWSIRNRRKLRQIYGRALP